MSDKCRCVSCPDTDIYKDDWCKECFKTCRLDEER